VNDSIRHKFKGAKILPMKIQNGRINIMTELSHFRDYIYDSSTSLKSYQNDFPVVEDFEDSDIENQYWEVQEKLFDFYPKVYFSSLLLAIYSYLEKMLVKLCLDFSRYGKGFETFERFENNNKDILKRSNNYLRKIVSLELDNSLDDWTLLRKYQKIRNSIAHNDSNIFTDKSEPIKKQALYPIVKYFDYISLDEQRGYFSIEQIDFILNFLGSVSDYLNKVFILAGNQLSNTKT
jgi:hypothetical protein